MKQVFIFLSIFLSLGLMAQENHAPLPLVKNGFVVIAHRGNHVHVPENTVASVKEAIKSGADYVEIDLRTTRDGYLVLSHDASVDRMTNGRGNVKDLTLEEIKKLAITGHSRDHKTYRIPEFKEILKACRKRINIYLDFKDADPGETYLQLKAAGMEKQVVVYLNKAEQYGQWKKVASAMPLMSSLPDKIKTPSQFRFFLSEVQLGVLDNVTDTAMLAVARENGVSVWLDVEGANEDSVLWNQALDKGIQGMQTDHPADLVAYLNETRQRNGREASDAGHPAATTGYNLPAYRKLSDIAYSKTDPENVLDAYIPADYENARVIVYIHGGGWTGGDKSEFPKGMIDELVGKRKYIVVSMNYRLVKDGKNIFPAQIEDISKALALLSHNAKKYHYRGDEFALMGGSAGAHLAMLYAYGYDSARQIKTVVDFWGPTDLADKSVRADNKDADEKVVALLGVADPQAQICLDASPYYRLSKETGVPTILFHGGEDPLVNYTQAEKMYKKLLSLGIPTQYEFYPHEKHGMGPASAVDVFTKTMAWLDKYFPAR
ncbi:MAG TPA: glycerophosphodiester phosphodiesterase family protein [Puia sp.]|nr:glycerophosphodiester phosphodiesterase family protein [Puia sp.]